MMELILFRIGQERVTLETTRGWLLEIVLWRRHLVRPRLAITEEVRNYIIPALTWSSSPTTGHLLSKLKQTWPRMPQTSCSNQMSRPPIIAPTLLFLNCPFTNCPFGFPRVGTPLGTPEGAPRGRVPGAGTQYPLARRAGRV